MDSPDVLAFKDDDRGEYREEVRRYENGTAEAPLKSF